MAWIPGIPLWKGLILGCTPIRIPNHRAPNHQLTISCLPVGEFIQDVHNFMHLCLMSCGSKSKLTKLNETLWMLQSRIQGERYPRMVHMDGMGPEREHALCWKMSGRFPENFHKKKTDGSTPVGSWWKYFSWAVEVCRCLAMLLHLNFMLGV